MDNRPEMIAFVICVAFAVAAGLVFFTITKEVNKCFSPEERYPAFPARQDIGRDLRILRDHKRFYPDDFLPLLYWCFLGLSILAFLFAVLSAIRDR